jgi:DNA-binding MarR family transcriptional regulator
MTHPPKGLPNDPASRLLMLFPRLMHTLKRDRMNLHAADPAHESPGMFTDRAGQHRLLSMLQRHERLTSTGIAEALDVSPPTVSTMVRSLAEHKLVSRERDAVDQRVVWITLSESGRTLLDSERREWQKIFQHRFEQLTFEDQALIRNALPAFEHLLDTEPISIQEKER